MFFFLALAAHSQTFTVNQDTLTQGGTVIFTNTSTGFPGGQEFIWRFGDDCLVEFQPVLEGCEESTFGTGGTKSHIYNDVRVCTATLMYKLSGGGFSSTSYTMQIVVLGGGCGAPIPPTCSPLTSPENFVVNGSFEFAQSANMPGIADMDNIACLWTSPSNQGGTPDLFAIDFVAFNYHTGKNIYGHETPQHGNRYAGFVGAFKGYDPGSCAQENYYREYVQAPLSQGLVAGRSYIIQFWVSLADTSGKACPISAVFSNTSNIGTPSGAVDLFCNSTNNWGPLTGVTPHFTTPVCITEKGLWTLVQFEYTPSVSGQQFLTIGYFNDATSANVIDLPGIQPGQPFYEHMAFYYIDNVRVYESCCMQRDYTVTAGAPNATNIIAAYGTNNIVDQTIYVDNSLTIDADITFTGCRLIMNSSSITVNNTRTLTVTDNILTSPNGQNYSQRSYIHAGCNIMWGQLLINAGGTLQLSNSCVNDSRTGIVSNSNTGIYNIANTVFDRNYKCVTVNSVGNYTGTLNGNRFKSSYPIMMTPHIGQITQSGVEANTTTNINVGNAAFNRNFFDGRQQSGTNAGMIDGVRINRSGSTIMRNEFLYLSKGINMTNSPVVANLDNIIGAVGVSSNIIDDCVQGIFSQGQFRNITITGNSFNFTTTYNFMLQAMRIYDPLGTTVTISSNNILDYYTGISVENVAANITLLTITNNFIQGTYTSPNYMRKGIYIKNINSQAISNPITLNTVHYNSLANADITSCTPNFFYDCNYHGISVVNCNAMRVEDNHVFRNITPTSAVTARLNGIRVESSVSIWLKENFNNGVGSAVYISGNCNPVTLNCNTGDNSWNQFRYNSATISAQGFAGVPWDNRWQNIPGGATNKMEGTLSGVISNWYYRNATNYTITPIVVAPALINPVITTGTAICFAPTARLAGEPEALTGDSATKALLLPIAENSVEYQNYPEATRYWAMSKAYQMLKADVTLRDEYDADETTLKMFYLQLKAGNIGLTDSIATLAALGDTLGVDALVNSMVPENNIETLQKTVLGIYAATTLRGHAVTPEDSTVLVPIGMSNPLWDGDAVYSARALLNSNYVNPEEDQNEELRTAKPKDVNVLVYPNPSTNQFFVSYNLGEEKEGVLLVTDLNGRLVLNTKLTNAKGLYILDTATLENGVYLYSITGTKGKLASGKLVLIK